MKVAIVKEIHPGERRVAGTPDTVKRLIKQGFEVLVEAEAGAGASQPDSSYEQAGATVVAQKAKVWADADIVLKVRPPEQDPKLGRHEVDLLREGQTLISFLWPAQNEELVKRLAANKVTALAMDAVPRISRAQKLDALSSMANIAGYRAVVEAASYFGRFFTGQITAAGKVPPAKVLVIGAGVAGLAAIGTAGSLGAIVRAFDTRPAVKEQVRSMGAEFLELEFEEEGAGSGGYAKAMSKEFIEAEMALFRKQAAEVDIIITTALIPGKAAPLLVPKDVVACLKPGSVVVDLAAEAGGNCELTEPGKAIVTDKGVTVIGYTDLPSRMAPTASQLYGTNLAHMLSDMGGAEGYQVDFDDVVVRGALIAHQGEVTWPPPKIEDPSPPAPKPQSAPPPVLEKPTESSGVVWTVIAVSGAILAALGLVAPSEFLGHLTVFVLSCFVGWQVVWNVTPALHTPLMSVTNAISGIIIIGGMLQISGEPDSLVTILAAMAVLVATINFAGGFLVTQRMLKMFQK